MNVASKWFTSEENIQAAMGQLYFPWQTHAYTLNNLDKQDQMVSHQKKYNPPTWQVHNDSRKLCLSGNKNTKKLEDKEEITQQ